MTTTQISEAPRPDHIVAVTTRNSEKIGYVVLRGNGTYKASRKHGDAKDMRRLSTGFRSLDNAIAWVEKSEAGK